MSQGVVMGLLTTRQKQGLIGRVFLGALIIFPLALPWNVFGETAPWLAWTLMILELLVYTAVIVWWWNFKERGGLDGVARRRAAARVGTARDTDARTALEAELARHRAAAAAREAELLRRLREHNPDA
ncbi:MULTISPECIES: hypothetical protein [Arthrobacter]|uniref:Uncharacterized protein n=2 Tax=Arthrobacter TaxID=1663 RepID=A0ABU9KHJ6_9MICC|nr:hypothetical protein [Arthrobacter sp. YJM1]MDP5226625.1 hypothetical protein [Arthrobacter sp. YJM1]